MYAAILRPAEVSRVGDWPSVTLAHPYGCTKRSIVLQPPREEIVKALKTLESYELECTGLSSPLSFILTLPLLLALPFPVQEMKEQSSSGDYIP